MNKKLTLILSSVWLLFNQKAQAIELAKHLSTVIEPEPIERVHPKYPMKAAREGRSGWSKFSFIVEKDGSVSNILEIASSGSEDFTIAAKKALANWKYTPALENGEPIQQCLNTVRMDFKMQDGNSGVRRRFRAKYAKALKLLEQKDYSEVALLIKEMEQFEYRFITENNYLHTIAAEYADSIGDKHQQLFHLSQITFSKDEQDTAQHHLFILNKRFLLAIELNHFQTAYHTYKQLTELPAAGPYLAKYDEIITKVDTFIGSEQDFVVRANIDQQDYWHYSLVRNEFSLIDIKGELNKVDVRCANKRHLYTVEANNTWSLPKSWKNCSLYVYGKDNTSFSLIEHPFKS